ncbi:MAG: YraN family protein [Spongiibacter sp.]|uniref:UPF0102 protein HCU74_15905 n=1 Tax=Spongiibacter thalassae TaxID=2721624 RepID=A0ABX1GK85_9GAMM|nr:YraN family protein [Spongiibacter sp.]NKI18893.1 YraN family protein [Spongiibacter thalassae]
MTSRQQRGASAEQAACDWLRKHRLQVIEQNYRCRFGEIDIIARDPSHLVFVEVRFRSSSHFGGGAASINYRKQQRIIHTASDYLRRHSRLELPCRFDVIEAWEARGEIQLNWIQDAFQL